MTKKKDIDDLLEIFRKNSGDKTTKTAKHIAKKESNLGKAKGTEKVGMTKGVFHITRDSAIEVADEDLKKKLKKMSKKEFTEFTSKNPKEDAKLAGKYTKRLYGDLEKEGTDLSNLTESEKAATIGNLYNYRDQPGIRKSISKLSQDRFIKSPEFIEEQKQEVAKNMDITTSGGKFVQGLADRREEEKALFLKKENGPVIDTLSKQDSGISRTPQMAKPIEEELDPVQETKRVVESKGGPVVGNMGVHVKDNVDKRSLNMDNIESSAAKSEQAQLEGKQVGIDDKFMSALGFFLPAVIGGLVGQQTGEGGMGVRLGLQASGAYHKAKNAHEELQLKKKLAEEKANTKSKGKIDITPDFVIKGTREPVGSREDGKGGWEFINASGDIVDPKSVEGLRSGDQKLKEARLTSQFDTRHKFNKLKFDLEVRKAGQVSGKQQATTAGLIGVSKDIEEISRLKKSTVTGPVMGRMQSIAGVFGLGTSNFQELKSRTSSVLANYVKSISGAQSSDKEAVRLQSIIPSVNDSDLIFNAKLKQLKKIQGANIEGFSLSMSTGQSLKAGTVKQILEVMDKIEEEKNKEGGRSEYQKAIKNAKSIDEINKIKKQYGAK